MRSHESQIGLFRAGVSSAERLRETTVARNHLLEDTLETLTASASKKSKHHLLFIGPRGMGKTHLLSLIEDGVTQDETLASRCAIARFPEESNRTRSFADFLVGLCEVLKEALPDEPIWTRLHEEVETEEDDDTIVDKVVAAVRRENKERERTLLVMLENLGEIFDRQIRNKQDLAAMRKFFMGHNGCLLIATAPLHFDAITDVGEPFYDFFDVQVLDQLSFEVSVELIRLNLEYEGGHEKILAKFSDMRPKLRALYQMTGGSPRLTMMLYELIAHDSVTGVQKQFHLLLDRITPFYQDRLNDLPPAQRALLECMASMRDQEKTPASIAAKLRASQPETSSLLKRLTDARYLRSSPHPGDKRSRLYTIREGFFDLWLAMNLSRGERKRLPFILDFFTSFYPQIEERQRKRDLLKAKLQETPDSDALESLDYLSEVGTSNERAEAKLDLARIHGQGGNLDGSLGVLREAAALSGGDRMGNTIVRLTEAATAPTAIGDYLTDLEKMVECWELHRSGNFESFAQRLLDLGQELTPLAYTETKLAFLSSSLEKVEDPEAKIKLQLSIGGLLLQLARWDEAEPMLRNAVDAVKALEAKDLYASALNNLARLLLATNRLEEAEPLMRQALEIDQAFFGDSHQSVATQLNNLAQLLEATNRGVEAEPLMRRALEIDQDVFGEAHPNVATTLNNLAVLLQETNRLDEAEPLFREALEIDRVALGGAHPNVAIDLNNLALLLQETNRLVEAEHLFREALEINRAVFGGQHPNVGIHLNNLALLFQRSNRMDDAEPLLREALKIDQLTFGVEHPSVAIRTNNLAVLFIDTNRLDDAMPLMLEALATFKAFERQTGHRHPNTDAATTNAERVLRKLGRGEDEIKEIIEKT